MEHDVLPDLLAKVQAAFEQSLAKSNVLKEAVAALRGKSATYEDVNRYAIEVGEALAEVLGRLVMAESLPDGKMYYNIAERLLSAVLGRNHELISSYAADVQTLLNQEARIGLKAQVPDFNRDRVDGLVNRLASEDDFEAVSWLLQEPIVNFSHSIVDDSIRINAEFHAKAGLSPKIVRRSTGHCCDWCQAVVGSYTYPDVPKDVYRRHQRCRCAVDYLPKGSKSRVRQDVWSKKEQRLKEVEARKMLHVVSVDERQKERYNRIMKRNKNPDKRRPINIIRQNKLTEDFRKRGGKVWQDDDSEAYLKSRGADAACLGEDIIVLQTKPTISEVLEELYHAEQHRRGVIDTNSRRSIVEAEIEAQRYLLSVSQRYNIPEVEIKQTNQALIGYLKELEELKNEE